MGTRLIRVCGAVALASGVAAALSVIVSGQAQPSPPQRAAPIFIDGQAQIVPEFQDQAEWIRHALWVETGFDSDNDRKRDRVFVDVTRQKQTDTEGLKVPVTPQGMQWLELKIPPVLVWLVMAGAMLGVSYSAPRWSFTLAGSSAIALAFVALGGALASAGVMAFRGRGTTVNPLTPSSSSAVVASGVDRISRNPMYLGFLLALAGWAVYLSNAGADVLLPAFVAYMTQFQIKPEEHALLAKFGSEFARYMSSVRRWL